MTNPVSGGFQFTPATGLNDAVTYPTTPVSEAAARQQIMDMHWQLMNEMNLPTLSAAAYTQYNKLINGNFDVWQRGTSFTNPPSIYTADRWRESTGGVFTLPTTIIHSRQALTTGDIAGAYYFYRVNVNGAGSGYGVDTNYLVDQVIENGTRYLCGVGKKVTLSFWARSSIVGKRLAINAVQEYGTGGSPSTSEQLVGTVINLTTTWMKYTFTFTTNTLVGKTFGTNNDDGLRIRFWYLWGSNFYSRFGASTSETFVGAGDIDIAQVQFNAGDQALPFQPRSFADELSLCQRYYEKSYHYATAPATATANSGVEQKVVPSNTIANAQVYGKTYYKVKKRITSTVTIYPYATPTNTGQVSNAGGTDLGVNTGSVTGNGDDGFTAYCSNGTGVTTTGNAVMFHWVADAEI